MSILTIGTSLQFLFNQKSVFAFIYCRPTIAYLPGDGKLALAMHTSAKLAVIVIEERGKSPHVLVVPMWAPLYLIIIMDQRTDYTTLQSKASRIETLYDLDLMVMF